MAIAGKVAITPKGNWNASTAYQKLDLVYYNNGSYVAIQPSTGVTPTNTAYWMLVLQSAGEAEFDELVDKINSIQSTSKGTLSTAGWYRVAEYSGDGGGIKGSRGNGCTINIKETYLALPNSESVIKLASAHMKQRFTVESSILNNNAYHNITKVRYAYDESNLKAYIEIYYNASSGNMVFVELSHLQDYTYKWQAITPTLTQETVDGVTVTTTYDIPANASPVTDLDIARFIGTDLNTSILEKALEVEIGIHQFRLGGSAYAGGDLPNHINWRYSTATIYKRNNASISVEIHSEAFNKTIVNSYNGVTWTGWGEGVTTADLTAELAKYLPLTGGTVDGNIEVEATDTSQRAVAVKNSLRRVSHFVSTDGAYSVYDSTNGKNIIRSEKDGTNTFNGTASGNLPLTGGTITGGAHHTPLILKSSNPADPTCLVEFRENNNYLGHLGFTRTKGAMVRDTNSNYHSIHHDGNSAKVHIGTSAPSDTSSLWIDTSA